VTAVAITATATITGVVPVAPLASGPSAAEASEPSTAGLDCSVTVTGQRRSGELLLSSVTCGAARTASRLSTLAIHYVDVNFGGGSLTIQGGSCGGGWLDLPAGWANTVSSTWSPCTSTHFDLYGLGGASEALPPGGGNLTTLHDRANSVRYT
jgi:hypothetical protein